MKAIQLHTYGGPEVLTYEDVQKPELKDGEILVHVHATSFNPVDVGTRLGLLKNYVTLPAIPGWDLAGDIEAIGAGVTDRHIGDAVYGGVPLRGGAYAEYCIVHPEEIALKPASIDYVQAATVPLASLTAWHALFEFGELIAGQTVLIQAAAGGVGTFAVQFAKWKGARVIATASGRNEELVRSLGADEFINYETTPFEEAAHRVDLALLAVRDEKPEHVASILKPGGILVSVVGLPPEYAPSGVRAKAVSVHSSSADLDAIASLIDQGHVKTVVSAVFPLARAQQVHESMQSSHARGKIALQV